MKNETTITSFKPMHPLAVPASVAHRLVGGILAILVGALVLWAVMGLAAQPAPMFPFDAEWQHYLAETLAFDHPTDWTVRPLEREQEGYRLTPSGDETGRTHITVAYLPEAAGSLRDLERLGVAEVERDETIARHFLRILSRTRVNDLPAARVRYTADLVSGERVEALWIGTPLPDGRVLTLTLSVYPDSYFKSVYPIFKRVLASVALG